MEPCPKCSALVILKGVQLVCINGHSQSTRLGRPDDFFRLNKIVQTEKVDKTKFICNKCAKTYRRNIKTGLPPKHCDDCRREIKLARDRGYKLNNKITKIKERAKDLVAS